MAKIYISSTYVDLQEYREKVQRVLRRMGHEDVAMEYYVAEDQRPVDRCLSDVAHCDLYIGIFGWRYGWIPAEGNPDHLSITEMEYRQAVLTNKACFIFLLSEEMPWPLKFIDKERTPIEQLRGSLSAQHSSGPHFTTPDDLGRLIAEAIHQWEKSQDHSESSFSKQLLDFDQYRTALKTRYQSVDLDALTPSEKDEYLRLHLKSVFVEQSVRQNVPPVPLTREIYNKLQSEPSLPRRSLSASELSDTIEEYEAYYSKPSEPVIDVLGDSRNQRVVILGDPGSGKSTLSRYILLSLLDDSDISCRLNVLSGFLPIMIELRSYAGLCVEGKCDTFLEYLEHIGKLEGWHLDREQLDRYLRKNGNALLIFDGLDEVFDYGSRERVTQNIARFALEYQKIRVIVTTRIIGYRRRILQDAGFSHYTLQDLDETQVKNFIDGWYGIALSSRPDKAAQRRERILHAFKQSASIRQLAGNPMLLTVMALIGKHQELPRERWKLYDYAANVLIHQWDVNKHLVDHCNNTDFISEDDKKELLQRLASNMHSSTGGLAGNYIHREQLQKEFEQYLIQRYAQSPDRAAVTARRMIDHFRERSFILSFYGANLYGFIHRAFLEYFCAKAFVQRFEKSKEITIDYLKEYVYGAHWEDRNWHEVLRLICGMVDEQFAGDIIDNLILEAKRSKPEEFHRRPPWNVALSIQCLSEVRNINVIAEPARRLLSAVTSLFDQTIYNDEYFSFLSEQILPYVKVIGPRWPHRSIITDWLNKRQLNYLEKNYATRIGEFIGVIGKNIDEIHSIVQKLATGKDPNQRVLALFAISIGWSNHDTTLPLIIDRALNDSNRDVRKAAVALVSDYFHDASQSLSLIHDLMVRDHDDDIRISAIWSLVRNFADDPTTLPLIVESVVNDGSRDVRVAAIATLLEYFRSDNRILVMLRQCAIQDHDEDVRTAAVVGLGKYFREDPATLPLIVDRALNDTSPFPDAKNDKYYVREVALVLLSNYWQDDPTVKKLLRERAEQDPTLWLRRKVKESFANSLFQRRLVGIRPNTKP